MNDMGGHTRSATIAFSPDCLGRALPFYLLLDAEGIVVAAGRALLKSLGRDNVLGRSVFNVVTIVKPRRVEQGRALQDVIGQRLRLELKGLAQPASATMSGMAFPVDHGGLAHVLIASTPGVNARSFIEDYGLKIADFGPADGSADLLPLLAMQHDMLEDSKKTSARLIEARDAAERLANHDALTGLPNRRSLMKALATALGKRPISLVHLDLDRFKEINDTYGHAAGDAALKHAAAAMVEQFGNDAVCARLGGDEFVAMISEPKTDDELKRASDALLAKIAKPFVHEDEQMVIGASIGLAKANPGDAVTADDILHNADLALYAAKRSGRGHVAVCTPGLLSDQMAFQSLTAEMRRALQDDEFEAYLQPQIEAETGRVLGFEALVRWNHPERGVLSPAAFLRQAERAGLIQTIDNHVRHSALAALSESDRLGTPIPKVSLNVTDQDLVDPGFRRNLVANLEARRLAPERIQLEIVESVLFDKNAKNISDACHALVDAGFILALDDFGTGHASVLSLMNLPVSVAKIDRAFTHNVASNDRTAAMAQALVGIAQTLGLDVLAEGVNDGDDVTALREMGCAFFQSYRFGKPMAQKDALRWMADRQPLSDRSGSGFSANAI